MLQGSAGQANDLNDGGPQFAEVFVVYWLGAAVVTLNIKLLGGSMYVNFNISTAFVWASDHYSVLLSTFHTRFANLVFEAAFGITGFALQISNLFV